MAKRQQCRHYLDFGAGVGSGGILFAHHETRGHTRRYQYPLQEFSDWRLEKTKNFCTVHRPEHTTLTNQGLRFVTAMDVFEHLVDPVETMKNLSDAI